MRYARKVVALTCIGALASVAGCFSLARTEPLLENYVLGAAASLPSGVAPAVRFDLAIGIRRLKLASYLDSPFIVVRRGPNQVEFAEFRRWGEPVEAGINRVVAAALRGRGVREVAVAPWPARARYLYVIQLDVLRFEGLASADPDSAEGGVLLLATWEISRAVDGLALAGGTTHYRRQGWRVGDYPGLVTLLDEGLGVLADDLTDALAGLPPVSDARPRNRPPLRDGSRRP